MFYKTFGGGKLRFNVFTFYVNPDAPFNRST